MGRARLQVIDSSISKIKVAVGVKVMQEADGVVKVGGG